MEAQRTLESWARHHGGRAQGGGAAFAILSLKNEGLQQRLRSCCNCFSWRIRYEKARNLSLRNGEPDPRNSTIQVSGFATLYSIKAVSRMVKQLSRFRLKPSDKSTTGRDNNWDFCEENEGDSKKSRRDGPTRHIILVSCSVLFGPPSDSLTPTFLEGSAWTIR